MGIARGILVILVLELTTCISARHSANPRPLLNDDGLNRFTSRILLQQLQQQQQQQRNSTIGGAPLLLPVAAVPNKPGCFWYKAVSGHTKEDIAIDEAVEPVMVCNPAGTVKKAAAVPAIAAAEATAEPDARGATPAPTTATTARQAQPAAAAAEPQQARANATAPVERMQVPRVVLPAPDIIYIQPAASPEPPQAPPCASCRRVVTPVCASNTTWDNACQAACRGMFSFTDGRCGGLWKVRCECPEIAEPVCAAGVINFSNGCLAECYGFLGYKPGACAPPPTPPPIDL